MRGKTPVVASGLAVLALVGAGAAAPVQRPQARPGEQAQPQIQGPLVSGQSIRTDNGRWSNNPTSFRYRWQRCASNSAGSCTDIPNADGVAYTLRDEDVGNRIRVWVTACNADGCTSANSRVTNQRVQARAAPRNTKAPSITGSAVVGQELTGDAGQWLNGVFQFHFRWERCNAGGACTTIGGATQQKYTVQQADLSMRLRFSVRADNNRGSQTVVSAPTDVVKEPGPAGGVTLPTGETSVPVSSVALPQRLVISGVKFEPSVVRSRAQPLVARFRVTDTRKFVVRDALVYAIGVPPNRVSFEGEVVTGQDGWATITFQVLRGQPLKRGATITFFVRARKPGEDILAGISARRLVSLRVVPR